MGRTMIPLSDGRRIVAGYDKPYRTWYAQLYDADDSDDDCPAAVIGYAPDEQALDRPDVQLGPFPVVSREELHALIRREWGIHVVVAELTP